MNRLSLTLSIPALILSLALTPGCKDGEADEDSGSESGSESSTPTETTGDGDGDATTTGDGDGDGDGDGPEEPPAEVAWPTLGCDSLTPDYCLFPYPNNVFTTADPDSNTGRRLALLSENLPSKGPEVLADPFNESDGFSPGLAPMTYMEGATTTGLPTWQDIDASLAADSPTILINAETGARVPHFAEIDASFAAGNAHALMIRPVERLDDGTRYIVALRNILDGSGAALPASPGFAALRDISPTEDADIETRRPLYTDIFARLGEAGIERASLQLAWDFTTASLDNNTGDLLHMRDDALSMYTPDAGPQYSLLNFDDQFDPEHIAFQVEGTIEVPLYLDNPDPGGHIVYGDDGLPEMQGMIEIPFYVLIPNSALVTPAPLLQYGHGLLGGATEIYSGHLRSFIDEYNYILFAVDWQGMADEDAINIAQMLVSGELHRFEDVGDRLQQGMVNFLVATRMMKTSFADDVMFGSYVDPSAAYYLGISQGGIFGGTFMALSQDIERGCLGVYGQSYNLLLNRSVDFDMYFGLLQQGFNDSRDLQILLALIQGLWDHSEPNGYAHKMSEDMFPDTPAHRVLLRAAVGDHQVTTLGAHIGARAMGANHIDTGIREVWGLEQVEFSEAGNSYVEYEFGLPEDPLENVPQEACEDPHGELRKLPEARDQLDKFLQDGLIENFCADAVCSFPELSGC